MRLLKICGFLSVVLAASGCAGTAGTPDAVRQQLTEKYSGKAVDTVVVDLGAPETVTRLDSGRKAYTWKRTSSKYVRNVFIKSDERCVITMLTDTSGKRIETVGEVDDSLGAYEVSYCAEQYGL